MDEYVKILAPVILSQVVTIGVVIWKSRGSEIKKLSDNIDQLRKDIRKELKELGNELSEFSKEMVRLDTKMAIIFPNLFKVQKLENDVHTLGRNFRAASGKDNERPGNG